MTVVFAPFSERPFCVCAGKVMTDDEKWPTVDKKFEKFPWEGELGLRCLESCSNG